MLAGRPPRNPRCRRVGISPASAIGKLRTGDDQHRRTTKPDPERRRDPKVARSRPPIRRPTIPANPATVYTPVTRPSRASGTALHAERRLTSCPNEGRCAERREGGQRDRRRRGQGQREDRRGLDQQADPHDVAQREPALQAPVGRASMIPPTAMAVVRGPIPPRSCRAGRSRTGRAQPLAPNVTLNRKIVSASVRIGGWARSQRRPWAMPPSGLRPRLRRLQPFRLAGRLQDDPRDQRRASAKHAALVAKGSAMPRANEGFRRHRRLLS